MSNSTIQQKFILSLNRNSISNESHYSNYKQIQLNKTEAKYRMFNLSKITKFQQPSRQFGRPRISPKVPSSFEIFSFCFANDLVPFLFSFSFISLSVKPRVFPPNDNSNKCWRATYPFSKFPPNCEGSLPLLLIFILISSSLLYFVFLFL